jgi:hypothetical protein
MICMHICKVIPDTGFHLRTPLRISRKNHILPPYELLRDKKKHL